MSNLSQKESRRVWAILVGGAIFVIVVLIIRHDTYVNSAQYLEDTTHAADGPDAGSDQCKQLNDEGAAMLNRWVKEDNFADQHSEAEVNRIMSAPMSDSERQIAMKNLSDRDDISKAKRDMAQNNEENRHRERLRAAGCLVPENLDKK
jgi:hypothetical protein